MNQSKLSLNRIILSQGFNLLHSTSLFILGVIFIQYDAYAGVNLRNGNYHIKYSDLVLKVGYENFRLDRDYNSHHRHVGIFGYGWTSELETRIIPGKNEIKLIEFGIKPEIHFFKTSLSMFQNSVGEVITISSDNSPKSYTLQSSNQSQYHFDAKGRLVKKVYPSGYHLIIRYQNSMISSVQDSLGEQLRFEFVNKKVKKIESSKGTVANYKYKENLLVNVINEDRNSFSYDYLSGGLLNRIRVNGKKHREIYYDSKTAHVKKIVEANSQMTRYEYSSSSKDSKDFSVTVIKKDGAANFHYLSARRKDGSEYVKSLDFVSNKKKIKTTYSKKCELPIRVEIKDGWEGLTYNNKCKLVSKRDSKGNKLDIKYSKENNTQIKQVIMNGYTVDYEYGKRNKPSIIKDSKNNEVKISYDLYGRTRKIEVKLARQEKKEVIFDYSQKSLKKFSLRVDKKDVVQAYYDENNNIVFDEDIKDKTEQNINIVFSTMNSLLNAHKF